MNSQRAMNLFTRPEMLRVGRLLRAKTQRELADETGIDQALISKYENGRDIPDGDLSKIAHVLQLPENFFDRQIALHAPNGASMMMFRRQQTASIKTQQQVIMEMNRLSDNIRTLLESVDVQGIANMPLYEPKEDTHSEIENIADRVRLELRVMPGPVKSMTRLLESVGVAIIHRKLPPKVDALVDGALTSPRILLLNEGTPGGRQRFNLAHELGHLVMHNTLNFQLDVIENQANRFAAAFLMPERDIKPELHNLTMERWIALSAEWRVSVQALVRRAFDLGILSDRQYRFWNEQFSKGGYRTTEPVPIQIEKPTLVTSLINLHLNELQYTVAELAFALAMEEWEFRQIYLNEPEMHIVPKVKKAVLRPFADGS